MSPYGDDLHRVTSNRSNWNDGHVDGHLNCFALRHGWTRKFSISPTQLAMLDYATFEAILELNTLKLRTSNLRVFVENPPNSGIFSKIRSWKDDGSLQSVLVKNFFEERMNQGGTVYLEIRDGHDREDTMSLKSGISTSILPGSFGKSGAAKDWLRRRGLNRTASSLARATPVDDDDDGELVEPPPPPKPSRRQALMYFLGLSSQPPQIPAPPKTQEQLLEERRAEEAVLRKRGWLPPMIRRITSRKSTKSNNSKTTKTKLRSENPFLHASERNIVITRTRSLTPDPHVDSEVEEEMRVVYSDSEGHTMESEAKPPTPQQSRWLRFRGPSSDSNSSPDGGKGKQKQPKTLTGATVVRKPMDAFKDDPGALPDKRSVEVPLYLFSANKVDE